MYACILSSLIVFCKIVYFIEKEEVKSLVVLDSPLPEMQEIFFSHESLRFDELEENAKIVKRIDKIDFDERKSFRIACERFNRTFGKSREDEIIIDCMIAFEALFVRKAMKGSSKKEKIATGCSDLLGKNNQEKEKIKTFLRKARALRRAG